MELQPMFLLSASLIEGLKHNNYKKLPLGNQGIQGHIRGGGSANQPYFLNPDVNPDLKSFTTVHPQK